MRQESQAEGVQRNEVQSQRQRREGKVCRCRQRQGGAESREAEKVENRHTEQSKKIPHAQTGCTGSR